MSQDEKNGVSSHNLCTRKRETAESIRDFILDYHAQRLIADGNVEEEETDMTQEAAMHAGSTDDCEDEAEFDSETKKPPKHVEIIMQVGLLIGVHITRA